jgi:basic amino acid/polyamine antiporter, APA family
LANIWALKSTDELAIEAAHTDAGGEVRPLRRTLSALHLVALGSAASSAPVFSF